MRGSSETVSWSQSDDGLRLSVPREQPCRHAFVYRIDVEPTGSDAGDKLNELQSIFAQQRIFRPLLSGIGMLESSHRSPVAWWHGSAVSG